MNLGEFSTVESSQSLRYLGVGVAAALGICVLVVGIIAFAIFQ